MGFAPASMLVGGTHSFAERTAHSPGRLDGEHILVPLVTPVTPAVTDQLRVAASLARTAGASLHIVDPVTGPDVTTRVYSQGLSAEDERELLEWAVPHGGPSTARTASGLLNTHRLATDMLEAVETTDVDTLVVPSEGEKSLLRQGLTERLAVRADCHVVTVNGRRGYEQVPSILLAVAGGPHSGPATEVARRIAADSEAWIDVLHVVPENPPDHRLREAETYVADAVKRIGRPETTSKWILEAEDVPSAIIEQSRYYGVTVVGAPTKGRLRRFISGSTNRTIRNNARSVVLSARTGE